MSTSSAIRTGLSGALQLVGSATVSGAAATSLTVSGLDLASDGSYYIEYSLINPTGSVSVLSGFVNGDTTGTNYDNTNSQSHTAVTSNNANAATIGVIDASSVCVGYAEVQNDLTGKPRFRWTQQSSSTSSLNMRDGVMMRRTVGNMTTLTITASIANSIGIGSYIKVYKIGAPVTQGTAFPTSGLVDGQRFFRTDLYLDCFYKASITSWLTVNEYTLNGTQSPVFSTAVAGALSYMPTPSDYPIYLTRCLVTTYTASNTGANYWTVTLSWSSQTNVETVLSTTNTSADTASNWHRHDITVDAVLSSGARVLNVYNSAKTGSPGSIHLLSSLLYRKVIT